MFGLILGGLLVGKTLKDLDDALKLDEKTERKLERAYRREMAAKNLLAENSMC